MRFRLRCGLLTLPDDAPAGGPTVLLVTGDEAPEAVWAAVRERTSAPFDGAGLSVTDWNRSLSPWPAPRVFRGGEDFAGEADDALAELTACLRDALPEDRDCWIAGYSLAGLFALYSLYRADRFSGAVCCSGSLWYPGFADFAAAGAMPGRPRGVYLSLGDREPFTRNPVMRTVQPCTERVARTLRERGIDCVFEWNEGNHFQEPERRLARGIAWAADSYSKLSGEQAASTLQ